MSDSELLFSRGRLLLDVAQILEPIRRFIRFRDPVSYRDAQGGTPLCAITGDRLSERHYARSSEQ
jgi:hypothetical protein